MIRGWLAVLVMMGYGALTVGLVLVVVLHNTPALQVTSYPPNATGMAGTTTTFTTASTLPPDLDWLYPVALFYLMVHALAACIKVVKIIDAYAWDHR